jgi:hypothetical protein
MPVIPSRTYDLHRSTRFLAGENARLERRKGRYAVAFVNISTMSSVYPVILINSALIAIVNLGCNTAF